MHIIHLSWIQAASIQAASVHEMQLRETNSIPALYHTMTNLFSKGQAWYDASDVSWRYTWWYYLYGDESTEEEDGSVAASWQGCAWYGTFFEMAVVENTIQVENNARQYKFK
jgi:hypothetical protein